MKRFISITIQCILIFLILMNLSYFKFLGEYIEIFSASNMSTELAQLYLILMLLCLILSLFLKTKENIIYLIIEIVIICLATISMIQKLSDFWYGIARSIPYYYTLLAITIYKLLRTKSIKLNYLLVIILCLTIGSFAFRTYISNYYTKTGETIYPNIVWESAGVDWTRDNVLRINPPSFDLIFVSVSFYFVLCVKNIPGKIFGALCVIAGIAYTYYIHAARSILVYQIVVLILMFAFQKVSKKEKKIRISILAVGMIILICTPQFRSFVAGFSPTNPDTGFSTSARLDAISYFGKQYLQQPLFGLGFLQDKSPGGGHIDDLGFLGGIYKLGIPMLVSYVLIFARGFIIWWNVRKRGDKRSLLVIGMTFQIILTGINMDCFGQVFGFALPFYMGIIEYINADKKKKKKQKKADIEETVNFQ